MDHARFDDYIARFNARDATAFDEYLHPELRMQNGRARRHGHPARPRALIAG